MEKDNNASNDKKTKELESLKVEYPFTEQEAFKELNYQEAFKELNYIDNFNEESDVLCLVYDDASKVVDWYFSDQSRLAEIKSLLLEEKAVDCVASKANVVEKKIDYKEAVAKK